MSTQVPGVSFDTSLPEVIAALIEYNTHRLVVVDAAGKAVGLISDADVVTRVQPEERHGVLKALRRTGPAPSSTIPASELMSHGILTALPETSVADAVKMMLAQRRKWLVVVDKHQKPLGLVDRQILLQAIIHS